MYVGLSPFKTRGSSSWRDSVKRSRTQPHSRYRTGRKPCGIRRASRTTAVHASSYQRCAPCFLSFPSEFVESAAYSAQGCSRVAAASERRIVGHPIMVSSSLTLQCVSRRPSALCLELPFRATADGFLAANGEEGDGCNSGLIAASPTCQGVPCVIVLCCMATRDIVLSTRLT